MQTRRTFLKSAAAAGVASHIGCTQGSGRRPNVVLIMSDDQGYGDLGCHGNDKIKTPNLDRLASESVQFTQFHVCPVCAPTRASLMTGRYNYRTGVVDTFMGRAMMHSEEVTLAEMLAPAGYRTGIFGKWHLGDNYPLRPMDQGFQESLVHMGGGIGQPSDPPGNMYLNPVLARGGKQEKHQGYCTDIFFDEAMKFFEENREKPFFAYIPTNAPHSPLQVEERYVEPYRAMGLDDTTAKIYGMVTNLDDNVGRLTAKLKSLNLEDDTLLIFLTDNGPQQERYNAGMRGRKGTVYEGGIRVPFFLRWPGGVKGGRKLDPLAAHIDVLPTVLEACGVAQPSGVKLDGISLMPHLRSTGGVTYASRTLYFQWHRGDEPEMYRACAARDQRYKLVDGKELYDLQTDPGEQKDIAAEQPERVAAMRKGYEEWFRDVSATRGYAPPRIVLGSEHENPSTLTRQDWRGPRAAWGKPDALGHWEVEVAQAGNYDVTLRFEALAKPASAMFKLGEAEAKSPGALKPGSESHTFQAISLPAGKSRLEAWLAMGRETAGVNYVDVKRLG